MQIRSLDKTIQELEDEDWGEPTYDSHLVTECHRLRRIPLQNFTVENLRIMIGQEIGLLHLLPLALEFLTENPLIEGDFYPGDLLNYVTQVPSSYWQVHSDQKQRLDEIVKNAIAQIDATEIENETDLLHLKQHLKTWQ